MFVWYSNERGLLCESSPSKRLLGTSASKSAQVYPKESSDGSAGYQNKSKAMIEKSRTLDLRHE